MYRRDRESERSRDRRGVSPVIAVVLLVAVTIVIGFVTAGFVLDIGGSVTDEPPLASFDYDLNTTTGEVTVALTDGDRIDGDRLRFAGAAQEHTRLGSIPNWGGQTVTAGSTTSVTVQTEETLRIVWENPKTGDSGVVDTFDVPRFAGTDARIVGTASDSAEVSWGGGYPGVRIDVDNFATPTGELYLEVETCTNAQIASRTLQSPDTFEFDNANSAISPDEGELVELRAYESDEKRTLIKTQQVYDQDGTSDPQETSGQNC